MVTNAYLLGCYRPFNARDGAESDARYIESLILQQRVVANFGVVLSRREIELRLLPLAIGAEDVDALFRGRATFPVGGPHGQLAIPR